MIILFSHANRVEYENITTKDAVKIMYDLDMFDHTIKLKNYEDIGGTFEVTYRELTRRIRFRDSVDTEFMDGIGKNYMLIGSLLIRLGVII